VGDTTPAGWFAFDPRDDFGASVIDASAWLDAPAGRHGPLTMRGDRFVFADGAPARFWGTNIGDALVFPERALADRWARYLAKYGVNAVRLHKFTWAGYRGAATAPTSPPNGGRGSTTSATGFAAGGSTTAGRTSTATARARPTAPPCSRPTRSSGSTCRGRT
jgi:hypothetical protein